MKCRQITQLFYLDCVDIVESKTSPCLGDTQLHPPWLVIWLVFPLVATVSSNALQWYHTSIMASPISTACSISIFWKDKNANIIVSQLKLIQHDITHVRVTSHKHHGISNHLQLATVFWTVCSVNMTVCRTVCSANIKENIKAAFVWGIHQWSMESPHKGPVMWKEFPCYDVMLLFAHWGHICVGKLTIIGSDNGLAPGWCQAIIWRQDHNQVAKFNVRMLCCACQ